jgi:hypothetical protein
MRAHARNVPARGPRISIAARTGPTAERSKTHGQNNLGKPLLAMPSYSSYTHTHTHNNCGPFADRFPDFAMFARMCIGCFSSPRRCRRRGLDEWGFPERRNHRVNRATNGVCRRGAADVPLSDNPTHKSSEIDVSRDTRLITAACLSYTLLYDTH